MLHSDLEDGIAKERKRNVPAYIPFSVELDMANYQIHYEAEGAKHLLERHLQLFNAAQNLWELGLKVIPDGFAIESGIGKAFNFVIAAIFAKQMRHYSSLMRDCERGMAHEAQMHVRAMFELVIHTWIMHDDNDPEEYARLWVGWCLANQDSLAEKYIDQYPAMKEEFASSKKKMEALKSEFSKKDWDAYLWNGPTKKSLKKRVELLDAIHPDARLQETFKVMYPLASAPSHGYDLIAYVDEKRGGGILMNFSPMDKGIEAVVSTGILTLYNTLLLLDEMAKLGKAGTVSEMKLVANHVANLVSD